MSYREFTHRTPFGTEMSASVMDSGCGCRFLVPGGKGVFHYLSNVAHAVVEATNSDKGFSMPSRSPLANAQRRQIRAWRRLNSLPPELDQR